jgi:hypothetical protein
MKNFDRRNFLISITLILILLIICFLSAYVEDEGNLLKGSAWALFSRLFNVLKFPTHTLFEVLFGHNLILIGFLINCLFYGFLIERLIFFSKA